VNSSWSRPLFNFDLAAWRRLRRRYPGAMARGLAARGYAAGALMSALRAWQQRRYGAALAATALEPPVFIVGHWRSGTSWLHELLALDERFATPRSYACFNPHHFLLSRAYQPAARQALRPTGDLAVSSASPQEEEFALLCLGAVSPYEAFVFPAAIEELEALSDPDGFAPAQARAWDDAFSGFARGVAYAARRPRLLLKSPPNSFRIARLRRLFPAARFVLLVREPAAVFASTLRLWESMWRRYALTPPPAQARLVERVFAIGLAMERALEAARAALPAQAMVTLRYEELAADAYRAVAEIYARLEIAEPRGLRAALAAYAAAHRAPPGGADVERWRERVRREWSALYDRYGY